MPRNVSGTYSLPLPPVVPNTVIQAAWANTTTDDIAQGITDSLDRQGRGGMIAPFRLVDGTVLQPAFAFNAETGTGLYREAPGILSVSVMGVKVGQFAAAGFTGTLAGPFSITGAISFAGAVNVAGRALFADGTLALPSISFTSDPDTGIYKAGVGELSFAADATKKVLMNINNLQVLASPTSSSPSMLIFAGNNAGGAGYVLDMLGSGVGTDKAIVRWLNNSYTIERLAIQTDSAAVVFGVPGALPMQFTTSNVLRLQIAAGGIGTYTGIFNVTGAHATAPNFWVGETSAAAGTVGISGGNGGAAVFWGNTSSGGGSISLTARGMTQMTIDSPGGSVVNYWSMLGSITAQRIAANAGGADANIGIQWATKGTGDYAWFGNGGVHLQIVPGASGTRWIQITGGPVDPALTVSGGRLNIQAPTIFTSAAAPSASSVGTTYTYAFNTSMGGVSTAFASNDDRVHEWYRDATGLYGRFMNAAFSDGNTWLQVPGGFASGAGSINLFLSNPGSGGAYLTMRLARPGTSLGYVGIGLQTNIFSQLQLAGPGQNSAAVFDFGDQGSTLYLWDTTVGPPVNAGGCIKFAAGTTGGVHFAAIKGRINNASGNTTGDLVITTKDTTADTGSTQALVITGTKNLYDYRTLTLARDFGTAAGSTMPIGSICIGAIPAFNTNCLTTVNAATNNITVYGCGTGTNVTITSGTWRFCGALSSSSNTGFWIRTA